MEIIKRETQYYDMKKLNNYFLKFSFPKIVTFTTENSKKYTEAFKEI